MAAQKANAGTELVLAKKRKSHCDYGNWHFVMPSAHGSILCTTSYKTCCTRMGSVRWWLYNKLQNTEVRDNVWMTCFALHNVLLVDVDRLLRKWK
jgi:hypothetical protein